MMNNNKSEISTDSGNKTFSKKVKLFIDDKVKNNNFFRRGGYSVVITAAVLAVIILLNYLVGTLSEKVNLEFDMTKNSNNSISEENIEYLKKISDDVSVIVCGKKSEYTSYLLSYSEQIYNTIADEKYFNQTVNFLEKYATVNEKINVRFVDMQSTEYTVICQQYPQYKLAYGDIIVSCTKNGNTRSKQLGFKNIYSLYDESGYASYGYDAYSINGNNLETALTSAISYAVTSGTHKVMIYTGHSNTNYSSAYSTLLKNNNYEVTVTSDAFLSEISSEYDSVAVMAPTVDFLDSEISALTNFLNNGGKGGKGLIYFADALNPDLPYLNDFLAKWGIETESGILFETNRSTMPLETQRTALFSLPEEGIDYNKDMNGFITGYNVPMQVSENLPENLKVYEVAATLESVVAAPVGASEDWDDYTEDQLKKYDTVIESKSTDFEKPSYVFAFSSIEFISSDWAENSSISNKNLVLQISDIANGNVANGISFVPKKLDNKSFQSDVTVESAARVKTIFVIFLPFIVLICGIVVFVRRRNSK